MVTKSKKILSEQEMVVLIERHFALNSKEAILHAELKELVASFKITPSSFTSLDEARKCEAIIKDKRNLQENIERALGLVQHENHYLLADIQSNIPFENVWVKIGKWAVGLYSSSWGGNHTELSIREWAEDLPKLKDHTYYP